MIVLAQRHSTRGLVLMNCGEIIRLPVRARPTCDQVGRAFGRRSRILNRTNSKDNKPTAIYIAHIYRHLARAGRSDYPAIRLRAFLPRRTHEATNRNKVPSCVAAQVAQRGRKEHQRILAEAYRAAEGRSEA